MSPTLPTQSDALRRHGFTEPGSEGALQGMVQLAAAFCGAPTVLALADESGIWLRAGAGFPGSQDPGLEPKVERALELAREAGGFACEGYHLLHQQNLVDGARTVGFLWVLAAQPHTLTPTQRKGLEQLAEQIRSLVLSTQQRMERRITQRGPAGASFVPGLVHELRNFIFGISGSLEAFEARFAQQREALRYSTVIRDSLDRMKAFSDELQEYGNPQSFSWAEAPLEPLLREVLDFHRTLAQPVQIDIQLQIKGPLPNLKMDARSLRTAFLRLIDLALQQDDSGGHVVLHVATRIEQERVVIFGHLDASGLRLPDVDLARLFEPFYYRASGLGRLGLPVARRIFETHGGNLHAALGPEGNLRMGFILPTI